LAKLFAGFGYKVAVPDLDNYLLSLLLSLQRIIVIYFSSFSFSLMIFNF